MDLTPASTTTSSSQDTTKHACSLCARRKVKCNRKVPCSNCTKAKADCLYESPGLHRTRKRAYNDDLLTKLAAYESLMRQHGIDYKEHAHTWVPSQLESSLSGDNDQLDKPAVSTRSDLAAQTSAFTPEEDAIPCLWSNLSPELKHLPVISLRHRDDPSNLPMPSLQSVIDNAQDPIHTLHPEPRNIYRLWQIFIEAVNPLTKVIHVPTLQQRILDASWNPAEAPPILTALMFSIYNCAVSSLSSSGGVCESLFGESRATMLARFRAASLRALIAIDFLNNRDLESLQAFCLFLFSSPESDFSTTLIGAAIKLAQKSGFATETTDPSVTFFEKEMRVRLWWQLRGIDGRSRTMSIPNARLPMPREMVGDLRLPLNVNDADLHPAMTVPPKEHDGPTEMAAILIKFEMFRYFRASPERAEVLKGIMQRRVGRAPTEQERQAVDELEELYTRLHVDRLDNTVPLHRITSVLANIVISRTKFALSHPRCLPVPKDGSAPRMPQRESDELFSVAVTTMEMTKQGIDSPFSTHMISHLTLSFLTEVVVYVISELRVRVTGERAETAWSLVEYIFTEYYEGLEACGEAFLAALTPLTVEAWTARQQYLDGSSLGFGSAEEPAFIRGLRARMPDVSSGANMPDPFDPTLSGFPGDVGEWWNNYLGF